MVGCSQPADVVRGRGLRGRGKRGWRASLVAGVLLACPGLGSAAPLRFQIPDGWRDLSPGVPKASFDGVPDGVIADRRAQPFIAYAVDLRSRVAPGRAYPEMGAVMLPGSESMSAAAIQRVAERLRAAGYETDESRIVPIGGVDCGEFSGSYHARGIDAAAVLYYIPDGDETALVAFSCPPERLADYRPVFETTAAAITGMVAPSRPIGPRIAELLGALAGVLLGGLAIARLRRRRAPRLDAAAATSAISAVQLVGQRCSLCAGKIVSTEDGTACETCRAALHLRCASRHTH